MTVVGCFFLLAIRWTFGAIDVQDDSTVDCFGYETFYPFDIQPLKALEVVFLSQPLRLEATHGVGAGSVPV